MRHIVETVLRGKKIDSVEIWLLPRQTEPSEHSQADRSARVKRLFLHCHGAVLQVIKRSIFLFILKVKAIFFHVVVHCSICWTIWDESTTHLQRRLRGRWSAAWFTCTGKGSSTEISSWRTFFSATTANESLSPTSDCPQTGTSEGKWKPFAEALR